MRRGPDCGMLDKSYRPQKTSCCRSFCYLVGWREEIMRLLQAETFVVYELEGKMIVWAGKDKKVFGFQKCGKIKESVLCLF